jgi:hypothetical protein
MSRPVADVRDVFGLIGDARVYRTGEGQGGRPRSCRRSDPSTRERSEPPFGVARCLRARWSSLLAQHAASHGAATYARGASAWAPPIPR